MKNSEYNIIKLVDWFLLITMICLILYAYVDGKFISREVEVVEVCEGKMVENGYYDFGITFESDENGTIKGSEEDE